VRILATSRQALRVAGECIVSLSSLESPEPSAALSAKAALAFPAVELFVQHASARAGEFLLSDVEAPIVAEICRRLDGNPLAIELAASSAALFGVRELAARLDARLALSMKGRRTAPSRQRTLHATLDWSYDTLSESERVVLRRLSVFKGQFSLGSAVAVVRDASLGPSHALNALSELSAKSLLVTAASGDSVRYRLLETTRAYACRKAGRRRRGAGFWASATPSIMANCSNGRRPARKVCSTQSRMLAQTSNSIVADIVRVDKGRHGVPGGLCHE